MTNTSTIQFPRDPTLPKQIDVRIRASSKTLHKHNSGLPFTITLAVTLPKSETGPNKPLTVFTPDTILDPKSMVFFKDGFELVSAEGFERPREPRFTRCHSPGPADWTVSEENKDLFLTLVPGETVQVTHMIKVSPKHSLHTVSDRVPWVSQFAQTDGLTSGSSYFLELGDSMNQIRWYRTGTKEQVLGMQHGFKECLCGLFCLGAEKPKEKIGAYNQAPIPLVMKNKVLIDVQE